NLWIKKVFSNAVENGLIPQDIVCKSRGGILADDMGLGKSLTTLCLIKKTQNEALKYSEISKEDVPATLIIVPLSTLHNWENEIRLHFHDGSLPYSIFHGSNCNFISFQNLKQNAVIITTYDVIAGYNVDDVHGMRINPLLVNWFRIVLDEAQIQILEEFRKNRESQVLLTTKGTGGVGIDLRCAQNVYIMEAGWNPSTDDQAVDRLYWLGHKQKVHVFHYITVGSIEVNIQKFRRKKQQLQMQDSLYSANIYLFSS
ncbi:hypothetical protein O181_099941, partial [Austropuccinia psidii MF-1]|nr:hypothetical protein [Austropuccinia psidii MF-1]